MWKFNMKRLITSLGRSIYCIQANRCISSSPLEFNSVIDVQSNVRDQILSGKPVVALESTIITHGMPYPFNLKTALEVEEIVKAEGSTPATIAVINGRIKVGLSKDELEQLAFSSTDTNSAGQKIIKCSKRDLIYAVSNKMSGGTTVAGTLFVAEKVGIKIFATGGIGGVHRDGQNTFDISADLVELGRTPVAVVCSGVKSILDIPKTLEYLETQGVFVASYQTSNSEFPAFYTRSSGCKAPYNIQDSEEAADLIESLLKLGLNSGILIGVPIPENESIPEKLINNAIETALSKCKENGIFGKEITPFVLEAVSSITQGKSLNSNIGLIKNNAKTASQIAVKLHKKISSEGGNENKYSKHLKSTNENAGPILVTREGEDCIDKNHNVPIVIGASILDITMKVQDDFKLNGATYITETKISGGGVGRNIAEGIWKLYGEVNLISAIGKDDMGENLINKMPPQCTKHIFKVNNHTTSICNVIFDKTGECKLVLGDMGIHQEISPSIISKYEKQIESAPLIIMDANLTMESMQKVLELSKKYNKPVFFEPSDMTIAHKPFGLPPTLTQQIKFISPNIFELKTISNVVKNKRLENLKPNIYENKLETIDVAKKLLDDVHGVFDCVILTLGSLGVIVDSQLGIDHKFFDNNWTYQGKSKDSQRKRFHFEAPKVNNLVNVSGAGDSFCSGFIAAMLKQYVFKDCISYGFSAAKDALLCDGTVPYQYYSAKADIKYKEIL